MRGDRQTLELHESAQGCLELRPGFSATLPAEVSSWTLRNFLNLKLLVDTKQNLDVPSVLAWLADIENKAIMEIVDKMLGRVPFRSTRSVDVLSSLWKGRVIGHGNSQSEVQTRELWRNALSLTLAASDFAMRLQEAGWSECLFDTAWDANIIHITSTRFWSLRMHCFAAQQWSGDVRRRDIWKILCEAETNAIERVAKKVPHFSESERRALLNLLDMHV
jgi:hypothetical protein